MRAIYRAHMVEVLGYDPAISRPPLWRRREVHGVAYGVLVIALALWHLLRLV